MNAIGNRKGFTLIELILGIVVAGLLGLFTLQYLSRVAQTNQLLSGQKTLVDEGQRVLEFLSRELRMADVTNPITFTPTSITFDKLNGYVQDTNTTGITYAFNSGAGTVERTSGGTTTTAAAQVTAFSVTQPAADFYVFNLTLQGAQGQVFTLETGIRPRMTT